MVELAWREVASCMQRLIRGKFSWLSLVHKGRLSCFVVRHVWQK